MKELTEYDQLQLGEKGIKVSKLQEFYRYHVMKLSNV